VIPIGRILAAVFAACTIAACSPTRAIESIAVLQDLSGTSAKAAPEQRTQRLAHRFEVDGRTYAADLYVPQDGAKAALVLVPGVTPEGKDDQRLIAFAETMSRAKFLVLVPDIATLRDLRVGPGDVTAIADAVEHLSRQAAVSEVGLVAISYSAGPALIAVLEERSRHRVSFLITIGGYYDIEAAAAFFTTGHFRETPAQPWQRIEPNPRGKWVFLKSNLDQIEDPRDRSLLREIAERKLRDLKADIGHLATQLGQQGQAVYALVVNRDPGRVSGLIAALPEGIRSDMARLSPKAYGLDTLAARLFLIHGRDDQIIPYTESLALRAAAPEHQADLYIVRSLAHVDLSPMGWIDVLKFWRAIYRVLESRDEMPAPDLTTILAMTPAQFAA
jgi:pimeloyl-ACP methyl ester carboxylesterase